MLMAGCCCRERLLHNAIHQTKTDYSHFILIATLSEWILGVNSQFVTVIVIVIVIVKKRIGYALLAICKPFSIDK